MSDKQFVHLHVHTEYSTLDGINRISTLPEHIKSMNQPACAITDHGNISGAYAFYKSCVEKEIKPIIGLEAYYTIGDRTAKEKDEDGQKYYHLVLLAENKKGLQNLYKLSTKAFTEGVYFKPRIDDELIADASEGIIATSACLGSRSSQLILNGRAKEAEALLTHHAQIFKDRFFIEVQLHEEKDQQLVNAELIQIAKRRNLPLILSNDCHYTHEWQKDLHEQALCMSTNAKMSDPPWNPEAKGETGTKTRFSFGNIDVHVAHHDWMWERAQKQGIPYEAISNSIHIANMIDAESYFADTRNRYPHYQDLPPGLPSWDALENLSKHKLMELMGGMPPQVYRDRMNYELRTIKKMGFSDYLLIVQQFINDAQSANVLVGPGRGSGAGSLVLYALGITQIDPIKYGLIFERFLNIGRAAQPVLFDDALRKKIVSLKSKVEHQHDCTNHGCGSHHHH